MIGIIAVFVVVALYALLLYTVNYHLRCGYWLPIPGSKYGIRRFEGYLLTPKEARRAADLMMDIMKDSLDGEYLNYPLFQDPENEMKTRSILFIYRKGNPTPVGFHCMSVFNHPSLGKIHHLGMVFIASAHQKHGLQKLATINLIITSFNSLGFSMNYILTSVANSPSETRLISTYLVNPFPDFRHPSKQPSRLHIEVAQFMLSPNIRPHMLISSRAKFDPSTFVIHGSNQEEGGGAAILTKYISTRKSKTNSVNKFLDERLNGENGDELFQVAHVSVLYFIRTILWS